MQNASFPRVASKLHTTLVDLIIFEKLANDLLGGVKWDFGPLKTLLGDMVKDIHAELPLKAYTRYLEFSASPPGVLMAKLRGKTPAHVTRVWAYRAGQKSSERKSAATRLNLERARAVKSRKRDKLDPSIKEAQAELKTLRRLLRRLKYRESLAARSRELKPSKRAPRKDLGRRAKHIGELQQKVRELEAKWPHLRHAALQRNHVSDSRQEWIFQPVSGHDPALPGSASIDL